jgi:chaperonin cofactor prefoldin
MADKMDSTFKIFIEYFTKTTQTKSDLKYNDLWDDLFKNKNTDYYKKIKDYEIINISNIADRSQIVVNEKNNVVIKDFLSNIQINNGDDKLLKYLPEQLDKLNTNAEAPGKILKYTIFNNDTDLTYNMFFNKMYEINEAGIEFNCDTEIDTKIMTIKNGLGLDIKDLILKIDEDKFVIYNEMIDNYRTYYNVSGDNPYNQFKDMNENKFYNLLNFEYQKNPVNPNTEIVIGGVSPEEQGQLKNILSNCETGGKGMSKCKYKFENYVNILEFLNSNIEINNKNIQQNLEAIKDKNNEITQAKNKPPEKKTGFTALGKAFSTDPVKVLENDKLKLENKKTELQKKLDNSNKRLQSAINNIVYQICLVTHSSITVKEKKMNLKYF